MGDKQNDVFIVDPNNNKKNIKINIHNHVGAELALGFSIRAASTTTSRCARNGYLLGYPSQTSTNRMGSRKK